MGKGCYLLKEGPRKGLSAPLLALLSASCAPGAEPVEPGGLGPTVGPGQAGRRASGGGDPDRTPTLELSTVSGAQRSPFCPQVTFN